MPPADETVLADVVRKPEGESVRTAQAWRRFVWMIAVLTAAFAVPIYRLVRFALGSELYSHIVLIPFISGYLVWLRRKRLPSPFVIDPAVAIAPLILGVGALAAYVMSVAVWSLKLPQEDQLALLTASYLLLLIALMGGCLGREMLRALVFPLGFLVFAVPMPVFLTNSIETFLQHGSAEAAASLFSLAGTPFFREDLIFQLPGITLQVAPECSGIHSTLALLITSILAGHFFLRSPVKRTILVLAVIPLALARNGVRIFTIGELCVHISPDMIHSYIHRQGGPVFFGLSLIPLCFLLLYLRRLDFRSPVGAPGS